MKVYIVVHEFLSHDMFVSNPVFQGPTVKGVYSTREEAEKYLRKGMDDWIAVREVDKFVRNKT